MRSRAIEASLRKTLKVAHALVPSPIPRSLSSPICSHAYLRVVVSCVSLLRSINVSLGPKEDRVLTTGLHTVCDIFCTTCEENIGWFYEHAFEESQKYKESKFIIEKEKMTKEAIG
jgi:hypothetical protein